MNPSADTADGYGGFALGGMRLALPLAALREVAPCASLEPLPCPVPSVIGGINVRGVIVPVLDLRIAFGRPVHPLAQSCVILMIHQGLILGLLVERVSGVFFRPQASINRIVVDDPIAAIFSGSIADPENGALVSLLSPSAIANIAGLPMVRDPEPGREAGPVAAVDPQPDQGPTPFMLVRSGRGAMAIEALTVHTTLADPAIVPSPFAGGHWRGFIDYSGMRIPAVDLQDLCGLGARSTDAGTQAFVIRLAAGMVAFLVDEVMDVIRIEPCDVVDVPGFALARSDLFRGALPATALPPELARRDGRPVTHFLVVDGTALGADPQIVALSSINIPARDAGQAYGRAAAARPSQPAAQRQMLVYCVGRDLATPLEQVVEILTLPEELAADHDNSPLLGILIDRGRSIPVLCLGHLITGAAIRPRGAANVLVVDSAGELVGFAVAGLKSISQSNWEPALPATGTRPADALSQAVHSLQRALCVDADGEHMLPVLDLQRIAALARAPGGKVAGAPMRLAA